MKKNSKRNLPLLIGISLFLITRMADHFVGVPEPLSLVLMILALLLEIWGIVLIVRSPEMKNSKLRQAKLRLFGRMKSFIAKK